MNNASVVSTGHTGCAGGKRGRTRRRTMTMSPEAAMAHQQALAVAKPPTVMIRHRVVRSEEAGIG